MKNLIRFIINNVHWLLLLLLLFLSSLALVKNNSYQGSKYLTIENEIVGSFYSTSDNLTSYIHLRSENEDLTERMIELEEQILRLNDLLKSQEDSLAHTSLTANYEEYQNSFEFITARVINSNLRGVNNILTLNKGSKSGVLANMGVVSSKGLVGIVMSTSENYSLVIPILNPKFRMSCKLKHSSYTGSMSWDGKSFKYANLEELPRHAEFLVGDTIVTSGYSAIFPEGLVVGYILEAKKQRDDNFNSLKISLSSDFTSLNQVLLLKSRHREEQFTLETGGLKQ
ncbi:cell shape-determining protein MreC [Bacteroidales bacterium]|nr:cell shape-determining protein MreC [Bacteroidales bacterium]